MSEETKSTSPINFDPSNRPRRQDYKVYFQDFLFAHRHYLIYVYQGDIVENGMFYFSRRDLLESGLFQGGKCGFVEIPQEYSVEIDTPFDLAFAEQVLSQEYIQLFM